VTNLAVRPYEPQDFVGIEVDPRVQETRSGQPVDVWAQYHLTHGPDGTVVDPDGRIVACIGVHHFWEGTGEVWIVLSPLAKKYVQTAFFLKAILSYGQKSLGYRRLQAAVREDWPEAVRLVELLGFRKETVMKGYGPNGIDQALYALVQGVPND